MPLIAVHSFPGFCESRLSGIPEYEVEREEEYLIQERQADPEDDLYVREGLRVDETGVLSDYVNWPAVYTDIAKMYVNALNHHAEDVLGFPAKLEFEYMSSPREYNFETDRLFITAPDATVLKLYEVCGKNKFVVLRQEIEDRCTSCSGFHSWYSNDLADWQEKLVLEWDHNKLGILLEAAFKTEGEDDISTACTEYCEEAGESGNYTNPHTRWRDYKEWLRQEQDKRRALLPEDDPDYAAPVAPRCPDTPDMLEQKEPNQ